MLENVKNRYRHWVHRNFERCQYYEKCDLKGPGCETERLEPRCGKAKWWGKNHERHEN